MFGPAPILDMLRTIHGVDADVSSLGQIPEGEQRFGLFGRVLYVRPTYARRNFYKAGGGGGPGSSRCTQACRKSRGRRRVLAERLASLAV